MILVSSAAPSDQAAYTICDYSTVLSFSVCLWWRTAGVVSLFTLQLFRHNVDIVKALIGKCHDCYCCLTLKTLDKGKGKALGVAYKGLGK